MFWQWFCTVWTAPWKYLSDYHLIQPATASRCRWTRRTWWTSWEACRRASGSTTIGGGSKTGEYAIFSLLQNFKTMLESGFEWDASSFISFVFTFVCRFELCKKLGQGTYGKVQLGINKETGQRVTFFTFTFQTNTTAKSEPKLISNCHFHSSLSN